MEVLLNFTFKRVGSTMIAGLSTAQKMLSWGIESEAILKRMMNTKNILIAKGKAKY